MATLDLSQLQCSTAGYGLAVYPPGASFGPRRMIDFEFVWILDGHCSWEADGEAHALQPGSLVLSPPEVIERYEWDPDSQTRHAFVHFRVADTGSGLPPTADWPRVRHLPSGDVLRPLFRHLIWLLDENRPGHADLVQMTLKHLVAAFVLDTVQMKGFGRSELPGPVERALQAVQRRWRSGPLTQPSLTELATAAGVSAPHLCRLFRDSLGLPPARVLLLLRLDRAGVLLSHSNLQIQEVAQATGFVNPYHFTRCFREVFGQPPSAFRASIELGTPALPQQLMRIRHAGGFTYD